MQTKELIEALRKAEGSEALRGVYLGQLNAEMICKKAADALEATLWRDDVENAPKNTNVLIEHYGGFYVAYHSSATGKWWSEYGHQLKNPANWKPLTPPEAE
jgi:hypothetical protein